MPISAEEAFAKRRITRDDGVEVLPRPFITVAAIEAGYSLNSPMVDEAVATTTYPGQMTAEEFAAFCEKNSDSLLSVDKMAKAVVVVAPTGVITRKSLQDIMNQSSNKENNLSEEEIEALFSTLDTEDTGAFSAEDFMRSLYGDEGVTALNEQRKRDASEADARREMKEDAEKAAAQEREEKAAKEAAEKAEEKAAQEAQEAEEAKKAAAKKEETEKSGDDKASKTSKGSAGDKEKKKKASACC